jgi:hypothetical protein
MAQAANASITQLTCSFRTNNGHYVTAVGGGGRNYDVIHTDAVQVQAWERFVLVATNEAPYGETRYGIRTMTGNFLTAVGAGGKTTDVIHSDAVQLQDWEKFQLIWLGGRKYAIRTFDGHYVTAVGGGGMVADAIHTDATQIGAWEKFTLNCGN